MIHLDKEHTLTLVSGYDVRLRKRMTDKLAEIEAQGARSMDPIEALRDPVTLRAVLLQRTEERIKLEVENKALGVKAKTLAVLEGADGSMRISDATKTLGVGRNELIAFLQRIRWTFKRPGNKNWLAYDAMRPRYMEHDDHPYQDSEGRDRVSTRALVTAAGLVTLADLPVKHGVKKPEGGDA
ncbi:phage antirepressor KilAC domain-containing protein [Xanthobacter sp. DSM 24535]|uniref:phage antirepressor KilAC domain-containing protein n=1 Tax=Roseixanthobacter psychrophilus TaxID=3119917 RepID=UPI00372B4CD8